MSEMSELSRAVSHALRHEPWLYELELDEAGWTPVEVLLDALRRESFRWSGLQLSDLQDMIEESPKRRHEIEGSQIRALYGHSVPGRIVRTPGTPPAMLFHGTAAKSVDVILSDGLRPMGRHYVHLSVDLDTAVAVGRRKSVTPVILRIAGAQAGAAGTTFYSGNDLVWLAEHIPAAFISLPATEPRGA